MDSNLVKNPVGTLKKHILDIDKRFLELYLSNPSSTEYQRAGSCLNVVMILDDMCYVANVGDCRSIMSTNNGAKIYQLSRDHKPSDPSERDRVIDSGGKIYVSAIKQANGAGGMTIQRTDRLVTKTDNIQ
jgi:serine/threonine protein phosphatase PrpC